MTDEIQTRTLPDTGLPTGSAMKTAVGYMRHQAQELEKLARTVSGSGEGAEIYRDAVRCIEFAMSCTAQSPDTRVRKALEHYSDQYCEGWCKDAPAKAHFDDCGGCKARLALAALPQPGAVEPKLSGLDEEMILMGFHNVPKSSAPGASNVDTSTPSNRVEKCLVHSAIIGLDGKWRCQRCDEPIVMAEAYGASNADTSTVRADEDPVLEVWNGDRKVTVYEKEVMRIWGPDMEDQMCSDMRDHETVAAAFDWLYAEGPVPQTSRAPECRFPACDMINCTCGSTMTQTVQTSPLTRTQFIVQMVLAYARLYPTAPTERAMSIARTIYNEFISDEDVEFGDAKYAWDAAAASTIVHEYEGVDPLSQTLPAELDEAGKAVRTIRNELDRTRAERDSWEAQFHSAAAAASEYSEFWEKHHGDFDQFGNYIPYSQMDGDLRAAKAEIERLRANPASLQDPT